MSRSPSPVADSPTTGAEPEPKPARVVETERGREVRTPKKRRLLGIFNERNQLVIKRGDELVIVEVPTT